MKLLDWHFNKELVPVSYLTKIGGVRWVLYGYLFLAIFQGMLANNRPILVVSEKNITFPIFSQNAIGLPVENLKGKFSVWPIVKFRYSDIDSSVPPLSPPFTLSKTSDGGIHWLGTDHIGRDVLAGVLRGMYISMIIGVFGSLGAAVLGIWIGMWAGYQNITKLRMNLFQALWLLFNIGVSVYVLVFVNSSWFKFLGLLVWWTISYTTYQGLRFENKWLQIQIPLDAMVVRIMEIKKSIPSLILILALVGFFGTTSLSSLFSLIIGLGWFGFAGITRAETLITGRQSFVESARALGISKSRIVFRHILPSIWPPLAVYACMMVGSNIIIESSLSFIGLGLAPEEQSWGTMIAEARKYPSAWWLYLCPGICMVVVILMFQRLSSRVQKILNSG